MQKTFLLQASELYFVEFSLETEQKAFATASSLVLVVSF